MIRKRTKFQIINSMLKEIEDYEKFIKLGIAKTRLIRRTGLEYNGFILYFKQLEKNGLIDIRDKKVFINKKGKQYLKKSSLLLLEIRKLNNKYSISLDEVNY